MASYPDISPYLYAEDNPIYLIDVQGMAAVSFNEDPPTKTKSSVFHSQRTRDWVPDEPKVNRSSTFIRRAGTILKYTGNANPVVRAIRMVFEPVTLGKGDVPIQKPRPPSEEEVLKGIMHLTNDPANDLSDLEKKNLEERINSGMASQNEKLQYRMLGKTGSLYSEGIAHMGASGRIRYDSENGKVYGMFNGKELGFYEYSEEDGLELDLNVPKEFQKMGLGTEMFNDAMKATKATRFTASWVYGSLYEGGMSTNLKVYLDGLSAGKEAEKAAWDTPSGGWAKEQGFKHVKVINVKNGVKATFSK